eukprot:5166953-Amphidinium_carterae.1
MHCTRNAIETNNRPSSPKRKDVRHKPLAYPFLWTINREDCTMPVSWAEGQLFVRRLKVRTTTPKIRHVAKVTVHRLLEDFPRGQSNLEGVIRGQCLDK